MNNDFGWDLLPGVSDDDCERKPREQSDDWDQELEDRADRERDNPL